MPLILKNLFSSKEDYHKSLAKKLLLLCLQAMREENIFIMLDLPDRFDERLEILSLFLPLIYRRLDKIPANDSEKIRQYLSDLLIEELDDGLRESGISDIRIGKKVKEWAKKLFGRLSAYHDALSAKEAQKKVLIESLQRNIAPEATTQKEKLPIIAEFMITEDKKLHKMTDAEFLKAEFSFSKIFL